MSMTRNDKHDVLEIILVDRYGANKIQWVSRNNWLQHCLEYSVSFRCLKKIGFPTIFSGFCPPKKSTLSAPAFLGHPHLHGEAVPTWPQLAAVIPTLNVPGRSSSLDDKACWGGIHYPLKIQVGWRLWGRGLGRLEEIFRANRKTCKYGRMVSGCWLCFFWLEGWIYNLLEGVGRKIFR